MIKLKNILFENHKYHTEYYGNCVDLIKQFGDPDSTDPAMWMQEILGDDNNVYRISADDFFKFVNPMSLPKKAITGKNPEYYYIVNGGGHPYGNINFVLYSDTLKGDDIHYFINVTPDPIDEIKNCQRLPNDGSGAGSNMNDT